MSLKFSRISAVKEPTNAKTGTATYATRHDFCQIFCQHMKDLYLLALLLTADHRRAEQCFVASLEDCMSGRPIFREWAERWSRRTIITNAIWMISPATLSEKDVCETGSRQPAMRLGLSAPLEAILRLEPFERFAFVLSVFERYTVQECSILFYGARADVIRARTRALQKLAEVTPAEYSGLAVECGKLTRDTEVIADQLG